MRDSYVVTTLASGKPRRIESARKQRFGAKIGRKSEAIRKYYEGMSPPTGNCDRPAMTSSRKLTGLFNPRVSECGWASVLNY
jgi:hypothetical protein